MRYLYKRLLQWVPSVMVSVFVMMNSSVKLNGEELVIEHYTTMGITKFARFFKPVVGFLTAPPFNNTTGNKKDKPKGFELWVLKRRLI